MKLNLGKKYLCTIYVVVLVLSTKDKQVLLNSCVLTVFVLTTFCEC